MRGHGTPSGFGRGERSGCPVTKVTQALLRAIHTLRRRASRTRGGNTLVTLALRIAAKLDNVREHSTEWRRFADRGGDGFPRRPAAPRTTEAATGPRAPQASGGRRAAGGPAASSGDQPRYA